MESDQKKLNFNFRKYQGKISLTIIILLIITAGYLIGNSWTRGEEIKNLHDQIAQFEERIRDQREQTGTVELPKNPKYEELNTIQRIQANRNDIILIRDAITNPNSQWYKNVFVPTLLNIIKSGLQ